MIKNNCSISPSVLCHHTGISIIRKKLKIQSFHILLCTSYFFNKNCLTSDPNFDPCNSCSLISPSTPLRLCSYTVDVLHLKVHTLFFFHKDLVAASCQCILVYSKSNVTMEWLTEIRAFLFFALGTCKILSGKRNLCSTLYSLSPSEKSN